MTDRLAEMVRSYLEDPAISLKPGNPDTERRTNTWFYSVDSGPVDVAEVVAALRFVADRLRMRLSGHGGVATFYAWYDEQAGQLRCSLRSVQPDQLPFGGAYRVVTNPNDVVRIAATDPDPGVVPWDELTEVRTTDAVEQVRDPFPVWAQQVC